MVRKRRKKNSPAAAVAVATAKGDSKKPSKKRKLPSRIDPIASTNPENNHDSVQTNAKIAIDVTNSRDNVKSILFLEEQVKIHEATLLAWRQRREAILVEREAALAKKRDLIDLRANLIERQANLESAQSQHLALQAELKESLAMSREKLNRLTMLESEEANESNSDMSCSYSEEEEEEEEDDAKYTAESDMEKHNESPEIIAQMGSSLDDIPNDYRSFEVFDSYENAEELAQYHHSADNRKDCSLLPFLPYLDYDQVGEYLILMQRETCAMDQETAVDMGRSFRRQLFQNTCLDILLLAVPRRSKKLDSASDAYSDEKLPYFDPSISLCPYELGGVCADGLCPYQHTTKDTKILARERLPLPSLPPSLLSMKGKTIKDPNDEEDNTMNGGSKQVLDNEHHKVVRSPAAEPSLGIAYNDTSGEEDFISLPTSSSPNDDNKIRNDNGGLLDAGDNNAGEGKDQILLSQPCNGDSKDEECNTGDIPGYSTFWWNEDLSDNPNAPNHENTESLSLFDILEDTFGLCIQEHPKSTLPAIGDSSTSAAKRLKIKTKFPFDHQSSDKNDSLRNLKALGRLIDASRLAIHGGLHDMILSLDQNDLVCEDSAGYESLNAFSTLLFDQTRKSRFFDQCAQAKSCFEEAFATQLGLAILSWSLAANSKSSEGRKRRKNLSGKKIASACKDCFDDMRNPIISTTYKQQRCDVNHLEDVFRVTFFHAETQQNYNTMQKLNELKTMISWIRSDWFLHGEEVEMLDESFEERLLSIWSAAKAYLSELDKGCKHDKSNGDSVSPIDPLEEEYSYLQVVTLVGFSISECLSGFARAFITKKETDLDGLSASNMAVWSLLDITIGRLLKDMKNLVDRFPLSDLVLAPLYAHSVASASYLRKYSTAQARLVECLSVNHRLVDAMNVMVYSELLWSQLVQLRMSLPNEAPVMGNPNPVRGDLNSIKLLVQQDAIADFAWEPSKELKKLNKQFIDKIKNLDIRLRHVVLWGDWLLSSLTGKYQGDQTLLRLFSENRNEPKLGHNDTQMSTKFQWKDNLEIVLGKSLDNEVVSITNSESSRCYPPPAPLPRLPLFLLYAGKYLTELDLKGCHLEQLPFGFGLYFPNLRKLDISDNDLRELPDSFRRLTHTMTFLEEFNVASNKLENLPPDMFSVASKQSVSLVRSPLRVLILSHNRLVSIPSLVGLDQLEILDLEHNSLLDMFAADWSRLALRLPALRILNRNHQRARDKSQNES